MPPPEVDYDKLGASVAKHMHHTCSIGLTPEDALTLRDFARSWRSAKHTALATVVTAVVLAVIGLASTALGAKIMTMLRMGPNAAP